RTTLQALYAIYDNCNSLHTNAYDEAITTPTEESVRRALAIQLIINRELGLAKNENPLQGSFIIEELTDLVEEAVLMEFERISSRGGVLGAMERQYQRTKIQEESLYYEQQKESGNYPIIGVNTFLSKEGSPFQVPEQLVRSTPEARDRLIADLRAFQERNRDRAGKALADLQEAAVQGRNIFEQLMEASKVASLGQMSLALYDVRGQSRRNMSAPFFFPPSPAAQGDREDPRGLSGSCDSVGAFMTTAAPSYRATLKTYLGPLRARLVVLVLLL